MSMAPRPGARAGRRSWPAAVGSARRHPTRTRSAPNGPTWSGPGRRAAARQRLPRRRPIRHRLIGRRLPPASRHDRRGASPRLSPAQGGIVELSLTEAGHHPFVNRTVPGYDSEIPRLAISHGSSRGSYRCRDHASQPIPQGRRTSAPDARQRPTFPHKALGRLHRQRRAGNIWFPFLTAPVRPNGNAIVRQTRVSAKEAFNLGRSAFV
jgi:hypothetical protein